MNSKDYIATIIIATYNHEQYIAQTIESVLNQKTTFDFKLLITEDASTDRTRSIISNYMVNNPDNVFCLMNDKNLGLNETLKRAIPLIDTKYTCILGGDDYWIDPNKLQMQVEIMENNPDITYVHTGYKIFDESSSSFVDGPTSWFWEMPKDRKKRLLSFLNHDFTYYPCGSTCCFLTDPFLKGFNNHTQLLDYVVGEATLLHASMCIYGNKYYYLPQQTVVYRKRLNSLSHYQDKQKEIDYKLSYVNLKVVACNMFGINEKSYKYLVKNTINPIFRLSYEDGNLPYFKKVLLELLIDKKIKAHYALVLSSHFSTYFYYLYLVIRDVINYYLRRLDNRLKLSMKSS